MCQYLSSGCGLAFVHPPVTQFNGNAQQTRRSVPPGQTFEAMCSGTTPRPPTSGSSMCHCPTIRIVRQPSSNRPSSPNSTVMPNKRVGLSRRDRPSKRLVLTLRSIVQQAALPCASIYRLDAGWHSSTRPSSPNSTVMPNKRVGLSRRDRPSKRLVLTLRPIIQQAALPCASIQPFE